MIVRGGFRARPFIRRRFWGWPYRPIFWGPRFGFFPIFPIFGGLALLCFLMVFCFLFLILMSGGGRY